MATTIRLQRTGHKGYAVYRVVVADKRAPRDGRFVEKLGMYNPNTNPATVEINFERALYWVETGAQPTDTARKVLSIAGVMMMKHLRGGVKKGAFDETEAQKKFDAWMDGKQKTFDAIKTKDADKKNAFIKASLEAEKKVNEAIAKKVADKKAAAIAAAQPEQAEEAPAEEATETPAE